MDKLTELEKYNRELLDEIRSKAHAEDMEMMLPELELTETRPSLMHRRIPSWVAVAAMVTGLAIGFILPGHRTAVTDSHTAYTTYADTCCSIAQDDVNLSLLVTSL